MAVPNTDNITTTTLQLIRRRIADNIFKANPTSAWLLSRGRVKTQNGGKFIEEPLIYAKNNTAMSYSGYDRLNVAPTQELTSADFNWRQAAVSISISGEEELKNAGDTAVFDLLKQKVKIAEMSLMEWFDEKMHEAASSKVTKDPLGLDEVIDDQTSGGSSGWSTLGSINADTYSFWRNKIGPGGDGNTTMPGGTGSGESDDPVHIVATSTTDLNEVLTRMMNETGRGITRPDLILTHQHVYERYENDNRSLGRIPLQDRAMLDVGFENQKFKGATMMWNENIKAHSDADYHSVYFLNSRFLGFTLHARRNFTISNFVSPWDQDARVAQILLAGNMTCNNRRHQGVVVVDLSP